MYSLVQSQINRSRPTTQPRTLDHGTIGAKPFGWRVFGVQCSAFGVQEGIESEAGRMMIRRFFPVRLDTIGLL